MQVSARYFRSIRLALTACAISATAGCWQKIEYKGDHSKTSSPSKAASAPVATNDTPAVPNASVPNPAVSAPPTVEPRNVTADVTAPPPTPNRTSPNTATESADDRYAAPSAPPPTSDVAPAPPKLTDSPTAAATPSTKSAEVDRYATAPGAASPTADSRSSEAKLDTSAIPANAAPAHVAAPSPQQVAPPPDAITMTAAPASAMNTKRTAWLLGSRLSLAALANDRGIAAKSVPEWFADSQQAAKILKTTVPDLPSPAASGDTEPASKQVMNYLLVNGQRIGHDLTKQYGPAEASLFEVALKSNLLLLIYRPGTLTVDSVSAAIQESAARARLPEKLWTPLIDAINSQAPPKEVQADVRKFHSDVDQYLAGSAEPNGK